MWLRDVFTKSIRLQEIAVYYGFQFRLASSLSSGPTVTSSPRRAAFIASMVSSLGTSGAIGTALAQAILVISNTGATPKRAALDIALKRHERHACFETRPSGRSSA